MTNPQQPPVTPGYPVQPPQADWTPPKASSKLPWILGAVAVIAVAFAVVLGLALIAEKSGDKSPSDKSAAAQPIANAATPEEPAATTTPAANRPYPSQFELTPKITSKQCFGSAGCNVELEVKMAYDGAPLSEDDTWAVTYEITGDESGPIIGTIQVTGSTYDVNTESLSTKSSKTKISIKVTDVEKVGI